MKALLTLSEMPEKCNECPCKQDDFFIDANHDMHSVMICGVRGYNSTEPDKRPEWCPLKELPDKLADINDYQENAVTIRDNIMFAKGWNACLDEVCGTED